MQAQIIFLKGEGLLRYRAAVERRHQQVRDLWDAMLNGIGVERPKSY
jgi:hypothetical protein